MTSEKLLVESESFEVKLETVAAQNILLFFYVLLVISRRKKVWSLVFEKNHFNIPSFAYSKKVCKQMIFCSCFIVITVVVDNVFVIGWDNTEKTLWLFVVTFFLYWCFDFRFPEQEEE